MLNKLLSLRPVEVALALVCLLLALLCISLNGKSSKLQTELAAAKAQLFEYNESYNQKVEELRLVSESKQKTREVVKTIYKDRTVEVVKEVESATKDPIIVRISETGLGKSKLVKPGFEPKQRTKLLGFGLDTDNSYYGYFGVQNGWIGLLAGPRYSVSRDEWEAHASVFLKI